MSISIRHVERDKDKGVAIVCLACPYCRDGNATVTLKFSEEYGSGSSGIWDGMYHSVDFACAECGSLAYNSVELRCTCDVRPPDCTRCVRKALSAIFDDAK